MQADNEQLSNSAPDSTPPAGLNLPAPQGVARFWYWFGLAAAGLAGFLLILFWAISSFFNLVTSFNQSVVDSVEQASERALGPVGDLSSSVGTQVAQFLHPTPTVLPNPVTIIHEIRSMARLETAQYTLEKLITAGQGQGSLGVLFGDKLLFVAHGVVVAGVDLAKLRPEDLWIDGGVLYVRLPAAEIFIATLDNDKSYVYDRETGLLTKGDINLETTARQVAEYEIEKAALEGGILELAQVNAENYMVRLLRNLGYPDVIFVPADTPIESSTATPAP